MQDSNPFEQDRTDVAGATSGDTRGAFLRKAGVGGVALVGGSALLGAVARPAWAGDVGDNVSDVDVLNYALTLEYLEATFYTQALGGSGTTGVSASSAKFSRGAISSSKQIKGFGGRVQKSVYGNLVAIRNHEVQHVQFLRAGLGAAAVNPATFDFSAAFKSVTTFLATASLLENTGVMAYDGAIRYVDKGDFLQAGATIATVEARHASYLNVLTGKSPFPSAFDTAKKPSEIFAAAKGFITSAPPDVVALFGRLP
ncbi:MAG: ferritin-like domain-containing protein [Actinobacteria bacterium]|nr:ferritin-like domain-containing protein [Actinomycetota bacterium]